MITYYTSVSTTFRERRRRGACCSSSSSFDEFRSNGSTRSSCRRRRAVDASRWSFRDESTKRSQMGIAKSRLLDHRLSASCAYTLCVVVDNRNNNSIVRSCTFELDFPPPLRRSTSIDDAVWQSVQSRTMSTSHMTGKSYMPAIQTSFAAASVTMDKQPSRTAKRVDALGTPH